MKTKDPLLFVPRDSGFFSAFNFLLGAIVSGQRVYPYFNRQELLKRNSICRQFCYWTNSDNSWLDFFEPIRYYKNDVTHISNELLKLPHTQGADGPKEFTIPADIISLLRGDKDIFNEWRSSTHKIYSKYIKFKQDFLNDVDKAFSSNFSTFTIGIHYRHPSHYIEGGATFFKQYFEHLDPLVQKHPDCKIFVASDTDFGILAFQQRYRDKVKFIVSTERLSLDNILEWAFAMSTGKSDIVGFINNNGYDLHTSRCNYQNNKKILYDLFIEVLFLSKCNLTISGVSNIPLTISYLNPVLDMIIL